MDLIKAEQDARMFFKIMQYDLINQRRNEIKYPMREVDENVGGGKSNKTSSACETAVINLCEDPKLLYYESIWSVVGELYQSLGYETQRILQTYYIYSGTYRHGRRPSSEVSEMVNKSKQQCEMIRKEFLEDIADKCGYFD